MKEIFSPTVDRVKMHTGKYVNKRIKDEILNNIYNSAILVEKFLLNLIFY